MASSQALRSAARTARASPRRSLSSSPPRRPAPAQLDQVPAGAWDSHMHVTDPATFPVAASATYAVHAALLPAAQANAARLRLPHMVFVQPSTYGTDNSCLLAALAASGGASNGGRGVVVFDPDPSVTTDAQLREWHAAGVRGARVNLQSVGARMERAQLLDLLGKVADRVRPLGGWALQVFARLGDVAPLLEELVGERLRGVKLVLDHLALPEAPSGRRVEECPGGNVLMRVLRRSDNVFLKVSAPYRLTGSDDWRDLEPYVRDVLEVRDGGAGVFASDWPHTRFETVDVMPWIERCVDWCDGSASLRDKLFRDNAMKLWDVPAS